jgi:hypothetical protein
LAGRNPPTLQPTFTCSLLTCERPMVAHGRCQVHLQGKPSSLTALQAELWALVGAEPSCQACEKPLRWSSTDVETHLHACRLPDDDNDGAGDVVGLCCLHAFSAQGLGWEVEV